MTTEAPGGKHTTFAIQQHLGRQVIDEIVKNHFRAVHGLMNTSHILRQFMGPYISILRDYTQVLAYSSWEKAGYKRYLAHDLWLGAERYVDALGVWARSIESTPAVQDFEQRMGMFMHAMPIRFYLEKVRELARQMWEDAGCPWGRTLEFWVAAENHILTLACQTVAMANTVADAAEKLTEIFGTFAAEEYLKRIREAAYYTWEASGRTNGHAFDDWLKAECQALRLEPQDPFSSSVQFHEIDDCREDNQNERAFELEAEGVPFGMLYVTPKTCTLGWGGELDFSTLDAEALKQLPSHVAHIFHGSIEDVTTVFLILSTNQLFRYELGKRDDYSRYKEAIEKPGDISFARYDVRWPDAPQYSFTAENSRWLDSRGGELTIQLPKTQHWSENLFEWVMRHHAGSSELKQKINPTSAVRAISQLCQS